MAAIDRVRLEESWRAPLAPQFEAPFMAELRAFLMAERLAGKAIAPAPADWFRALDLTPLPAVRVVILGQDPYPGPGQAHGLCFSVPHGVRVPRSLGNIYRELADDVGFKAPAHGCLEAWARAGVLLLNNVLTIEPGRPASHVGKGWEPFTDAVVQAVASRPQPAVFLLWGRHARQKARNIDPGRHLLLTAAHPSPLSASNGFFGCRHFSRANEYLAANGLPVIDWALPPG